MDRLLNELASVIADTSEVGDVVQQPLSLSAGMTRTREKALSLLNGETKLWKRPLCRRIDDYYIKMAGNEGRYSFKNRSGRCVVFDFTG